MSQWVFEAKDRSGKQIRGTREAPDRQAALDALRSEGLFLTRLEAARGGTAAAKVQNPAPARANEAVTRQEPKASPAAKAASAVKVPPPRTGPTLPGGYVGNYGAATSIPSARPNAVPPTPNRALLRSSSKDISIYFSQLGSMIHAGTTIGQALHIMAGNAPNNALRQASREMQEQVMSGVPMSTCMHKYPGLFTPLQIGILSAGERGGFMERMFNRLAEYAERDYKLQQTIKRETFYPKALVFAAILISAVPVLFLKGVLAFLAQVGPPFLFILLVVLIIRAIKFTSPLALHQSGMVYTWDQTKLLIPVVSKVTRALATAKFSRALAALYSAGVGPGESVRLAAKASGNEVFARSAVAVIPKIENGERLTDTLESTGHFTPIAIQMMRVGEDSGALDEQLDKAADFLEGDAETAIRQATVAVGILALLAVAAWIGFQVVQFWTGFYGNQMDVVEGIT